MSNEKETKLNEKTLWEEVDKVLEKHFDEIACRWEYEPYGNEYEEIREDLFEKAGGDGVLPDAGMLEEIIENYALWYNEEHKEYELSAIADAKMERMKGEW